MANLKKIKNRINSIKSTQTITREMKIVASAKVKKIENKVKASRPFTYELEKMFYRLLHSVSEIESKETWEITDFRPCFTIEDSNLECI